MSRPRELRKEEKEVWEQLLGPVLHRALLLAVLKETERQRPPKNSCFPTGLQLGYNREIRH